MAPLSTLPQQLFESKLAPPLGGRSEVSRPRLIEWLKSVEHARLVVIRAPAGFGKTTLMAQWFNDHQAKGLPAAWLSLDEGDDDPVRFLTCLIAAIEKGAPQARPPGPGPDPISHGHNPTGLLMYLLEMLSAIEGPFNLFLDDFGAIKSPEVLKPIQQLLQHLPPDKRLVITSRHLPDLKLGRLRSQGGVAEIDQEGLRFSPAETREFIRLAANFELDEAEMESLYQSTEGWAAGLQLSTLSSTWRDKEGRFEKTSRLAIDNISEYLAEDVLSGQSEEVQSFLIRTSILPRLCAPLCDAVTGLTDSAEMLEYLERENLFIAPLDEQRHWYRYHSLFAKFLRKRLERRGEARLLELHRAASNWYAGAEYPQEAANHAMLAKDPERAAQLVEQCAFAFLAAGQMDRVVEWGERLDEAVLARHRVLRLAYALALVFRQQYEKAQDVYRRLRDDVCASGDEADFVADLSITRLLILIAQDDPGEAERVLSETVSADLEVKGAAHSRFLPAIFNIASYLNIVAERYALARKYLRISMRYSRILPDSMVHLSYSNCFEAIICLKQARVSEVLELTGAALDKVSGVSRYSTGATVLAVIEAAALYEINEIARAEQLLLSYQDLLPSAGPTDIMMIGTLTLARIQFIQGDLNGALRLLGQLERFGYEHGIPRAVATSHQEHIRMLLQRGDVQQALGFHQNHADATIWERFEGRTMIANSPETPQVGRVRLLLAEENYPAAVAMLKPELQRSEEQGSLQLSLLLRILQAKTLALGGETGPALAVLQEALATAQSEGLVRCFLDEGEPISQLVRELRKRLVTQGPVEQAGLSVEFLDRLQRAMNGPVESRGGGGSEPESLQLDPLTEREKEIMSRLAMGYSNKQMAENLFISVYTVQYHLRNIYSKLGVNNRGQAVALARSYGLID